MEKGLVIRIWKAHIVLIVSRVPSTTGLLMARRVTIVHLPEKKHERTSNKWNPLKSTQHITHHQKCCTSVFASWNLPMAAFQWCSTCLRKFPHQWNCVFIHNITRLQDFNLVHHILHCQHCCLVWTLFHLNRAHKNRVLCLGSKDKSVGFFKIPIVSHVHLTGALLFPIVCGPRGILSDTNQNSDFYWNKPRKTFCVLIGRTIVSFQGVCRTQTTCYFFWILKFQWVQKSLYFITEQHSSHWQKSSVVAILPHTLKGHSSVEDRTVQFLTHNRTCKLVACCDAWCQSKPLVPFWPGEQPR